jgi:hypothetical protein
MLTLGFDSYVEPLRTFLAKVRDASKYDRTMTMGGELTDDLRLQVAQAQVNQTSGPMVQAQVATTVQVQPQAAGGSAPLSGQAIAAKPTGAAANPNGLEPYGHSVRFLIYLFNSKTIFIFRFVLSLVFEMINQVKILTMCTQFNRINK